MKRSISLHGSLAAVAAAVLATLGGPAAAATTLTFEGATSFASVDNFYNGGTDSAGAAGSNVGAQFGGDLLALSNDAAGPYFSNAPTPGTVLTVVGSDAFINIAAGFTGAASFFYASPSSVLDAVGVYAGLNGTGALLGTFSLNANGVVGCSDSPLCHFEQTSLSFGGTAHSFGFSAGATVAAFDDVSFTAVPPPVPEPSSYALMALGLAAVSVVRRRLGR